MRFRMLGRLRARSGRGWVAIPAPQQRIVLAVLLVDAGRLVGTDKLIDAVWPDEPPKSASNTIAGYLLRLRRLLGREILITRGGGYELVTGESDIDAVVFERQVEAGRRDLAAGEVDSGAALLEQALALWHGGDRVLADVPRTATLMPRLTHLEQLRQGAAEDYASALIDLARHGEVVDDLHRMVEENPLRERGWQLLMTALWRCGRRAEALEAYQQVRQILRTELGLEPGEQLRGLQRQILAADLGVRPPPEPRLLNTPAAQYLPAQLPADVAGFTGRVTELDRLDALLLKQDGPAPTAVVATLAGAPGVGKTALAVRWGHTVRDHFPDGQLYIDLRGYSSDAPVRPDVALTRFLHALGVPTDQLPSDVDEAGGLYRSLLMGKRVLVLLDNARDPDQVRPLLPSGPGCMALVTSRGRLGGLIARDGAVPLTVEALADGEARALLAGLIGAERIEGEPQAAGELARLCDNLPLALRIAAANISGRPHGRIADYVAQLARDRLDALDIDDEPQAGVRAAFQLSYLALPDDARRLFRLLGLPPGPDLTVAAAAALADVDSASAPRLLHTLTTAHLVVEPSHGRYALHDLLRRYAFEKSTVDTPPDERRAALDRLHGHHVHLAYSAMGLAYPNALRLPDAQPDPAEFPDPASATEWLATEEANLVAIALHTSRHGPHPVAWRLANALYGYFQVKGSIAQWQPVAEAGLAAAEADGDQQAMAVMHFQLALIRLAQGRSHESINHSEQAVALATEGGWAQAQAHALNGLGVTYGMTGQLKTAHDYFEQACAAYQALGSTEGDGEAGVLANIGRVHLLLGQLERAVEYLEPATDRFLAQGATVAAARTQGALGEAYRAMGRYDDAVGLFIQGLRAVGAAGTPSYEADGFAFLADLYCDLGDLPAARQAAQTAGLIGDHMDDPMLKGHLVAAQANIEHHAGHYQHAIEGFQRALTLMRAAEQPYHETVMLLRLAAVHHATSNHRLAADLANQALDLARRHEYRMLEGQALTSLAESHLEQGNLELAGDLAEEAARIQTETGHRPGRERAQAIASRVSDRMSGVDAERQGHAAQR